MTIHLRATCTSLAICHTPQGWKARWLVTYMPIWFSLPAYRRHTPVQVRESNSRHVNHKSDALTTTLPSHLWLWKADQLSSYISHSCL